MKEERTDSLDAPGRKFFRKSSGLHISGYSLTGGEQKRMRQGMTSEKENHCRLQSQKGTKSWLVATNKD